MSADTVRILLLTAFFFGTFAAVVDIRDFGAVANLEEGATVIRNQKAINFALSNLTTGDTLLIPSGKFFTIGGIQATGLNNVSLRFDGDLVAVADFSNWSTDGRSFLHFIHLVDCDLLTVTGAGRIDGRGNIWWEKTILPQIFGKLAADRPKLFVISQSQNILVENITLHSSPSWTLLLDDVAQAEVRYVTVTVDRKSIQDVKGRWRSCLGKNWVEREAGRLEGLAPMDLNTDGIDVIGRDIWIHDCSIQNDDDSVAVKPANKGNKFSDCTRNILIENTMLTGFGASIGSVPPSENHNCVANVTFRNIHMPNTGKGIYVKSNPSCRPGATAEITDVLFEDVDISHPRWWAIWIGPQQQHQPGDALGEKCALSYPIDSHCPTQGCVTFSNIVLRRVSVHSPWLSPGVIMGNSTNPMDVVFDNVRFDKASIFPFGDNYKCENTHIKTSDSFPVPKCVQQ